MPATIDDPAAIQDEITELEERRDRLKAKRNEVNDDLQDARAALQTADADEGGGEALERAERLQIRADTLTEAITEIEVDLEALRSRLEGRRECVSGRFEARGARRLPPSYLHVGGG